MPDVPYEGPEGLALTVGSVIGGMMVRAGAPRGSF
jgi:hypothetical protein